MKECGLFEHPGHSFTPDAQSKTHGLVNATFLVIFLTSLIGLASLELSSSKTLRVRWINYELPASCVILQRTGKPCPSCGITRSLVLALHGDVAGSRAFHRAGALVIMLLLVQCVMRVAFLRPRLRNRSLDIVLSSIMLILLGLLLN